MAELAFSSEHRTQFKELLARGEVHAINLHPEQLEFGPWSLGCDVHGSDEAERLKSRFRAAARKAAIAAGAPARSSLLDWWVTRLARRQKHPYIQTLIQRSVEYCEELESNAFELRALAEEFNGHPGLSRDRYYSEWVPYWLYTEPHRVLPDAKQEFDYWEKYVWQGFSAAIVKIATRPRFVRRWVDENGKHCKAKEDVRRILTATIENRTGYLDACVLGLSYDLAVLRANYVIDRVYRGEAAVRAFEIETRDVMEQIRLSSISASKQLGLSWRKLECRSQDLARPFREVLADLREFLSKIAQDSDQLSAEVSAQADPAPPSSPEPATNPTIELLDKILAQRRTTLEKWAADHKLGRTTVFDWKAALLAGKTPQGKVSSEKCAEIRAAVEEDAKALGLLTRTPTRTSSD